MSGMGTPASHGKPSLVAFPYLVGYTRRQASYESYVPLAHALDHWLPRHSRTGKTWRAVCGAQVARHAGAWTQPDIARRCPKCEKRAPHRWVMPSPVTKVDIAFPARGSELTPLSPDVPAEFHDGFNVWRQFIDDLWSGFWMGHGASCTDLGFWGKAGIDQEQAWNHLKVVMGCALYRHQEKCAGAAYLCSLWFEKVRYRKGDAIVEVP